MSTWWLSKKDAAAIRSAVASHRTSDAVSATRDADGAPMPDVGRGTRIERIADICDLRATARDAESYFKAVGKLDGGFVPAGAVPKIIIGHEDLLRRPLDHRAGFVLSFIDGCWTVGMICDATGLGEIATLDILLALVLLGVVELDGA
jgi:hypothetical protein